MADTQTDKPTRQPLRLWPGVVAVVLQWLIWQGLPVVAPDSGYAGAMGGLVGGLVVAVWWLLFSRAPWSERLGAVALMIVALAATPRILHESMATAGQGVMFFVYSVPVLSLVFVAWAVAARRLSDGVRWATMAAAILIACGAWALVRTEGVSSTGSDFAWRWSATPEERMLARDDDPRAPLSAPTAAATGPEWPGFRGPERNGHVRGVHIETDWSASPPLELWRRSVGPGWSSFAVHGDRLYTQEQRGDDEVVSCYDAATGEPVWRHRDAARFWESNAGAGPRATPALSGGRVYSFGATGILNALNAADGAVVWSRDAASDTGTQSPYWGFSGSPLVTGDIVIVAVAATLAAYETATGEPRWSGPAGGMSYSSPHLLTLDGTSQVLLLGHKPGVISVAPADGTVLWEYAWEDASVVQPALTVDGDILISANDIGTRRLAVAHDASLPGPGGWAVEERWTSNRLKSNFNDFVVHRGHAFGFDGTILACIDVETGERRWKGGRYGQGQLVLLADQDLLLVVSEKGGLALVSATPDRFTEHARLPAIEGKTWNHPVLVGDLLLVRNDREMAAFRLSL